jgi:Coproporphyrinogen III oxidase and related Fe-S oxidoreductases
MSVGVQDFAPEVQQAVNRIQSVEETRLVIDAARANGFGSISLDLIYGLPFQNLDSFARTLDQVIEISPDRLSLYSYAHLPHIFKPQRRINAEDLPTAEVKLGLLGLAIRRLEEAGYVYIGMDHFAKPGDELARAQREGKLHRNFQGYSTQAELDLLAFGVSSISNVGNCYAQNAKTIDEYTEMLAFGKLPTARGVHLTPEDHLRRTAIQRLMCDFQLDLVALADEFKVDAAATFASTCSASSRWKKPGWSCAKARKVCASRSRRKAACWCVSSPCSSMAICISRASNCCSPAIRG